MLSPEHSEGFLGGGYLILCGMRIGEVVNLKVSDVINYNNKVKSEIQPCSFCAVMDL